MSVFALSSRSAILAARSLSVKLAALLVCFEVGSARRSSPPSLLLLFHSSAAFMKVIVGTPFVTKLSGSFVNFPAASVDHPHCTEP